MSKKSKQKKAGQHTCHQNKYQNKIGRTKPHRIDNIRRAESPLAKADQTVRPYAERVRDTAPQYRYLISRSVAGKKPQEATSQEAAAGKSDAKESPAKESPAFGDTFPKRGDIWFADLGDRYDTSIQCGERPVLILSNDVGNRHSETVSVVPLTSKMKKLALCTHVLIGSEDCDRTGSKAWGRMRLSMALAEQVTTLSKKDLLFFFCRVTNENKLKNIGRAVDEHLGILPLPQQKK